MPITQPTTATASEQATAPAAAGAPAVANPAHVAAFALWEQRFRDEPEGFMTPEETAAMAIATTAESRAIYFGALLRELAAG